MMAASTRKMFRPRCERGRRPRRAVGLAPGRGTALPGTILRGGGLLGHGTSPLGPDYSVANGVQTVLHGRLVFLARRIQLQLGIVAEAVLAVLAKLVLECLHGHRLDAEGQLLQVWRHRPEDRGVLVALGVELVLVA